MLFNSIDFLFFFPVVVSIYFFIPRKMRYIWLLISSYYFYMSWNPKYALLMGLSTIITFVSGLLIEACNQSTDPQRELHKKICVAGSLISNLLILGVFKYANFILDNLSGVLSALGLGTIERRLDFLLPVGISFYTFQALSYTLDVYQGKIKAEKNIIRYGLFVSFFPQLVAGPIERSKNLLGQIQKIETINVWNYERICNGALLMFWGLFQKLVIADRAAILVKQVYGNPYSYGFFEISIATVLFAFQIYCDFGGYSCIARGAAQVMGFQLMQNFRQPYLATTVKDFWRRWHISLTSWFTDYLYIPLGGNRKGFLRKYWNILVVFAVSGLWHGARWNFVAWGLLHAFYQISGDIYGRIKKRFMPPTSPQRDLSLSARIRKVLFTFLLVDFAWIFFVVNGFRDAIVILRQMVSVWKTTPFFNLGLDMGNWIVLIVAILILFITDLLHERKLSIFLAVGRQEIWFRWILYLGLIWSIIMLGIYGIDYDSSQFIYFQF
ncbi:MAG: MBOAT family protein [Lachnospiraceae bacterium]|nr:MBOAT family protein [Lachnospiraceae bacterium]